MNKWVNPQSRDRQQDMYFSMDVVTEKPFAFYLEQVGKKKIVNSKKSTRVADKSVSLAERIKVQGDK